MYFHALWGIALLAGVILLAFFAIGIADGSVSSFNIVLWLGILAGTALIIFGSRAVYRRGNAVLGACIAAVLAVPTLLYGLFLLVAVTSGVRWN